MSASSHDRSTVGIIANPAAGKDIRRLVSAASPISDMAKIGIVRRAAVGAIEGGAKQLVLADDRHALARRAVTGLPGFEPEANVVVGGVVGSDVGAGVVGGAVDVQVLDLPLLSNSRDSERAAAAMAELGVGAVIVLGGDGTHRDVAKGWRQAPMVALSTGTNNVFPRSLEATTAGEAAGLVASGRVSVDDVAERATVIDVEVVSADGGVVRHDLGLVDVALTDGRFTGSRAVWNVETLRELVAVIAEPDAVGLSAIAAAVAPIDRHSRAGVHLELSACGPGNEPVRCAVAPGRYAEVGVATTRRLGLGDEVLLRGPGVLSFDGERDVVLEPSWSARARIADDGPRVIDVARAMARRPPKGDG